jgi:hypothetical protein
MRNLLVWFALVWVVALPFLLGPRVVRLARDIGLAPLTFLAGAGWDALKAMGFVLLFCSSNCLRPGRCNRMT